jgi:hypothetical protein
VTTSHPRAGRALVVALFAALAVACDTPVMTTGEPAYDSKSIVPFSYHWQAGHDIAIYVDTLRQPDDADLPAAVRSAIAAWESIATLGEIRLHIVNDVHDADVIFHHYLAPLLVQSDVCPIFLSGAGGQTSLCVTGDLDNTPPDLDAVPYDLVDGRSGHVMMDVAVNAFQLDTASFFPALVVHEMGHVLGIGAHSPDATDLMFGRPRRFAPSGADAVTMRFVLTRRPDVWF